MILNTASQTKCGIKALKDYSWNKKLMHTFKENFAINKFEKN